MRHPIEQTKGDIMSQELLKQMLEAGVHFGHQTHRWNPKMREYIYTARDGVHIIDLGKTVQKANAAVKFVENIAAKGQSILFVGTKKQAKVVIEEIADSIEQYYVSNRWLGGMLTNFNTVRQSIDRLNKLSVRRDNGELERLTKKEALGITRSIDKLEYSLGGIKSMTKLPGAVFIVDPNAETIARKEANKLRIPVVALTDTNSDPSGIDYLIPGNDDAIRSIQLFSKLIADAYQTGVKRHEASLREQKENTEDTKPSGVRKDREEKIGSKGRAWVSKRNPETATDDDAKQFAKAAAKSKPTTEEEKK